MDNFTDTDYNDDRSREKLNSNSNNNLDPSPTSNQEIDFDFENFILNTDLNLQQSLDSPMDIQKTFNNQRQIQQQQQQQQQSTNQFQPPHFIQPVQKTSPKVPQIQLNHDVSKMTMDLSSPEFNIDSPKYNMTINNTTTNMIPDQSDLVNPISMIDSNKLNFFINDQIDSPSSSINSPSNEFHNNPNNNNNNTSDMYLNNKFLKQLQSSGGNINNNQLIDSNINHILPINDNTLGSHRQRGRSLSRGNSNTSLLNATANAKEIKNNLNNLSYQNINEIGLLDELESGPLISFTQSNQRLSIPKNNHHQSHSNTQQTTDSFLLIPPTDYNNSNIYTGDNFKHGRNFSSSNVSDISSNSPYYSAAESIYDNDAESIYNNNNNNNTDTNNPDNILDFNVLRDIEGLTLGNQLLSNPDLYQQQQQQQQSQSQSQNFPLQQYTMIL
ncbi:unnamed protein product [[Candida] boidinii]|nr:unnamed protein product [[Candida] boidinii]